MSFYRQDQKKPTKKYFLKFYIVDKLIIVVSVVVNYLKKMSFVKCCFEAGEGHDFLESFVQKCTDPGCKYLHTIYCYVFIDLY